MCQRNVFSLFFGGLRDDRTSNQIPPHPTRHTHSPHTFSPTPTFTPTLTRSFAYRAWALRGTLHGSHTSHAYIRTSSSQLHIPPWTCIELLQQPPACLWLAWLWGVLIHLRSTATITQQFQINWWLCKHARIVTQCSIGCHPVCCRFWPCSTLALYT
jgi:hypothetical protein